MKIVDYAKGCHTLAMAVVFGLGVAACGSGTDKECVIPGKERLEARLMEITGGAPGKIGVGVVYENCDTMVVNDTPDYPMMSMFKLHEAIAASHVIDSRSASLDSVLVICCNELDADTWSPMMKEHSGDTISLTVGELLDYTLVHSDNNTSNILFERIVTPSATDSYIRSISPEGEFNITWMEADMKKDIMKSYDNRTSPLAYACLVNRLFTDSVLSSANQGFIKDAMRRCQTGLGRIAAGLPADGSVGFAHRTGSGYVNANGEIIAVNDGGYVSLPDGRGYSIAVFVKDFKGPQEAADSVIALVSSAVYNHLTNASAIHD